MKTKEERNLEQQQRQQKIIENKKIYERYNDNQVHYVHESPKPNIEIKHTYVFCDTLSYVYSTIFFGFYDLAKSCKNNKNNNQL